jgi:hypothetical protein
LAAGSAGSQVATDLSATLNELEPCVQIAKRLHQEGATCGHYTPGLITVLTYVHEVACIAAIIWITTLGPAAMQKSAAAVFWPGICVESLDPGKFSSACQMASWGEP